MRAEQHALVPTPVYHHLKRSLVLAGRDPWLDAVMAQNQGATHILVEDAPTARSIEDTLGIVPWRPRAKEE